MSELLFVSDCRHPLTMAALHDPTSSSHRCQRSSIRRGASKSFCPSTSPILIRGNGACPKIGSMFCGQTLMLLPLSRYPSTHVGRFVCTLFPSQATDTCVPLPCRRMHRTGSYRRCGSIIILFSSSTSSGTCCCREWVACTLTLTTSARPRQILRSFLPSVKCFSPRRAATRPTWTRKGECATRLLGGNTSLDGSVLFNPLVHKIP